MLEQVVSLIGAAMILVAFGAAQANKLKQDSTLYLLLNLVGSIILAFSAIRVRQLGLTLLESAWAIITLIGLIRRRKA
jgi:hypothetical protein